ncbi:AAA domain (dynein-related subfamily) [Chitinophaga sp. YR627]|uniref:McrB family protein n=1 Tax=Chitinophaga sp. YR627 TaxID=1881041 RepID=UPI0008F3A1C7|nr:AAA family ATPase [Chitinophaga sp. YR627]SFN52629.1 AAA domain (dynein-related subfamily) [Chitinophaga sp. YR627]
MKPAKIYDVRGGNPDYHNLLSHDKTFIFWNDAELGDATPGEIVFFVNREEMEALYTIATAVTCTAVRNKLTMLKEFDYDDATYAGMEGDEFRQYEIQQIVTIPKGWKWQKPLRQVAVTSLWSDEGENTNRLERVGDLQQLFTDGPAWDALEGYNMHVEAINIPVNQTNIQMKLVTPAKRKEGLKQPQNRITGKVSAPAFGHPYRKLLMALKTKPFVLLGGNSGTGKSWTARKLAYMTCSDPALRTGNRPGNFEMVSVRPDWHEPDDLLGYAVTHNGILRYHCTKLLRFMIKAWKYPEVPFILCLDEMNLAQPEHYFSDFLSVLETARVHDGKRIYDPFIDAGDVAHYSHGDPTFWQQLGLLGNSDLQQQFLENGISMPANLFVIGTVNMNEITRTISTRLLDRAMTIEVKMKPLQEKLVREAEQWEYPPTYEPAAWLMAPPPDRFIAYQNHPDIGMRIFRHLEKLYIILEDTKFALSDRVLHQTLVYCFLHCEQKKTDLPADWIYAFLDEVIAMKILVRIAGDNDTCRVLLDRLLPEMTPFPASRQKVLQMQSVLENVGYTSYW